MLRLLLLACTLLSLDCAQAQSFSVIGNYPNNGGTAEVFFVTSAKGNLLEYGTSYNATTKKFSNPWLYDGHTAYQAKIVTVATPASQSSKTPAPATPSSIIYYVAYPPAEGAFGKMK